MTTPTYVQHATASSSLNVPSITPTLASPATAGNLLVLYYASGDNGTYPSAPAPSGFTNTLATALTNGGVPSRYSRIYHKIAAGGETAVSVTPGTSYTGYAVLVEYDLEGGTLNAYGAVARTGGSGGSFSGAWTAQDGTTGLTPTAGAAVILGYGGADSELGGELLPPGSNIRDTGASSIGEGAGYSDIFVASASGTYKPTFSDGNLFYANVAAYWEMALAPSAPVADFSANDQAVVEGETVTFTDLSTNSPTSWAWDFGDGGTSTSQNPSHVYSAAGVYSVTLTTTNATGSDSETKTAYIVVAVNVGYEEPPPAASILEVYAAAPGSARWDVANWDESLWSTAGWQDVTPIAIDVIWAWGSRRPELGILSKPEAADASINFFDPDRQLDPSNADSPFFGDVEPFLPVRLSHRGTVIRQGYATGIQYSFRDDQRNGFMRVTDEISRLANAKVKTDTALADTLWARAIDAISAAGLSVRVTNAPDTDPPLDPWVTGINDWSAWQWISDAADQVHYIPVISNIGDLTFRPWAAPLTRGRSLDSTNMEDLRVITDYAGLYSVIQATDDGVTIEERALTPPPRYGARTYSRDDPTINPDTWAETVLADRALPGLRWVPGDVYPFSARDVEDFATIEGVELVTIGLPEQDPPVAAAAIIVGGTIRVRGKRDEEGFWIFNYEAAATTFEPLIETGGEATDYLLATGGDQFLYPTT